MRRIATDVIQLTHARNGRIHRAMGTVARLGSRRDEAGAQPFGKHECIAGLRRRIRQRDARINHARDRQAVFDLRIAHRVATDDHGTGGEHALGSA